MLRALISHGVRTQSLSSRVVAARIQSRACSHCKSIKDWKELHGAWSRYSTSPASRRGCSQCKSVKDWKELHGAWSKTQSLNTQHLTASFATSSQLLAKKRPDVNRRDPAFDGPKKGSANTEPTGQPGSGKPAGKAVQDELPGIPDEVKEAGDPAKNSPQEPELPLPDLTKGIPSTIGRELEAAERARRGERDEEGAQVGSRAERAKPASDTVTSAEKRRQTWFKVLMGAGALGGLGFFVYQGRDWDTEAEAAKHPEAPSGFSLSGFYNRIQARLNTTVAYYNEPAFEKLLPDPDPQWSRPYTLVISLEDLLIHQQWTREHGWRLAKRPGVDYFLRYLSQYYEIVIFTSLPSMFADPIIRKLDPFRIAMWPLFREATKYKNGEYIKDLSFLNRDLSKTILVDTSAAHASAQPENAIILPKWQGNPQDRELVALIPFLEFVAGVETPDIRKSLASFNGKHIPTEFARREDELRKRILATETGKKGSSSNISGIGGFFGMKQEQRPDGMQSLGEGLRQGKILHDRIREQGQMAYMELEKQIRENGDKILKEMAEEEQRLLEEARQNSVGSLTSFLFGGSGGSGGGGGKPSSA